MILFKIISLILRFPIPRIAETIPKGSFEEAVQIKTGLSVLFIILLIPLLIALIFTIKFIYKNTIKKRLQTTLVEDYQKEAEKYEKACRFVSAAHIYENKLKDTAKAASLYEKGSDYRKAAELYEILGFTDKVKEMHEKDGNIKAAAEVSLIEGEYEDAAKLYDKAGDKIRAAKAMEKAGRRLAAVRIYREAGEYKRAAKLLEDEGLVKESVEMFGFSLAGKKISNSNIGEFYTYALKLEKLGDTQQAVEIFKDIDCIIPTFKDVRERLNALTQSTQKDDNPEGKTTLRSFIKSGKIEPKYNLKLWVHILKNLQKAYGSNKTYGALSPDNICFDSQNNISFLSRNPSTAYASPEAARGIEPDVRSDIFSMGVILYEMLIGRLAGLGSTRLIDIVEDVPEWLDEIVIKCIKKVREDRYQSIEEIFNDLKLLSKEKKNIDEIT